MAREVLKLMEDMNGKLVFFHGRDRITDRDGIKLWLKELGLSRYQAAKKLGVTVNTIDQWTLHSGTRPPSTQAKLLMRDALARARIEKAKAKQ